VKEDEDKEFFAAEKFTSKKYSRSFRNIKRYFKDDPDYARLVKAAEKQSSKYDYYAKERPLFEMVKNQEIDVRYFICIFEDKLEFDLVFLIIICFGLFCRVRRS